MVVALPTAQPNRKGSAPLTCVIYTSLVLREMMESMRIATERHLEYRILLCWQGHDLVSKRADNDHGAQRGADRDREQDRVHDETDDERHGDGEVGETGKSRDEYRKHTSASLKECRNGTKIKISECFVRNNKGNCEGSGGGPP